jgi:hypothetical protein
VALSDDDRARLAALSPEEWRSEVNLGRMSRYNEEKRAHMQALLQQHDEHEAGQRHAQQVALGAEANRIAKEANGISAKSFRVSMVALIVAVVAAVAAIASAWYAAHPPK